MYPELVQRTNKQSLGASQQIHYLVKMIQTLDFATQSPKSGTSDMQPRLALKKKKNSNKHKTVFFETKKDQPIVYYLPLRKMASTNFESYQILYSIPSCNVS